MLIALLLALLWLFLPVLRYFFPALQGIHLTTQTTPHQTVSQNNTTLSDIEYDVPTRPKQKTAKENTTADTTNTAPSNDKAVPSAAQNDANIILANATSIVQTIDQVPEEGGWINTAPLNISLLQKENKVIVMDFWTHGCINCIRDAPHVQQFWEKYKDHGLVIIGVHSPEFEYEHKPANILAFVKKAHLTYPIMTDGDMTVWNKFGNHFWPGKYIINPKGTIVYTHFGEGDYDEQEQAIRKALKDAGWQLP